MPHPHEDKFLDEGRFPFCSAPEAQLIGGQVTVLLTTLRQLSAVMIALRDVEPLPSKAGRGLFMNPDVGTELGCAVTAHGVAGRDLSAGALSGQAGSELFSISRFFVTIASPFFVDTSMPVTDTARHSSIRPSLCSDCARA